MSKTILVAGIVRSGLTLMMQILHKGGYPCFGSWPSFENYNFGLIPWTLAKGRAVKLVDTQKQFPPHGDYHVIRLRRDLKQQTKSIIKLMKALGISVSNIQKKALKDSIKKDYKIIDKWAIKQKSLIYIDFENMINNPEQVIQRLNEGLELNLSSNAIKAVKKRSSDCYDGFLEFSLM